MIKSLIILQTLFLFYCNNNSKEIREHNLILMLLLPGAYNYDECINYTRLNQNYLLYYHQYKSGTNQYKNIIIGDSTMQQSSSYSGFLSNESKSVAVASNTMCDMLVQFPAINTIQPTNIIISTSGGNDLDQGLPNEDIFKTGRSLLYNTVLRFKNPKIVVIGIHPTKVNLANIEKEYINSIMEEETKAFGGCFVDPQILFGVEDGEGAKDSDMIDDVHYNMSMSFKIKNKIKEDCGIVF